jgi:hypothetical protein
MWSNALDSQAMLLTGRLMLGMQGTWDDLRLFVVVNGVILFFLSMARSVIGHHTDVWENLCACDPLFACILNLSQVCAVRHSVILLQVA